MSHGNIPPKFRSGRNLFMSEIGYDEMMEGLDDALRAEYGDKSCPPQRVATDARTETRTAENWLMKRNAPKLLAFFNLCRNNSSFRQRISPLLGWEQTPQLELESELTKLRDEIARRREERGHGLKKEFEGGNGVGGERDPGSGLLLRLAEICVDLASEGAE